MSPLRPLHCGLLLLTLLAAAPMALAQLSSASDTRLDLTSDSSSSSMLQGPECPEEQSEVEADADESEAGGSVRWPRTDLSDAAIKASLALSASTLRSSPFAAPPGVTKALGEVSGMAMRVSAEPPCFSPSGDVVMRKCSAAGWIPATPPICYPAPRAPSPPHTPGPRVQRGERGERGERDQRRERDERGERDDWDYGDEPGEREEASRCPPPYEAVPDARGKLCLATGGAGAWTPLCLRTGASDSLLDLDEELRDAALAELRRRNASRVWLPARRASAFGPLLRRLPGRRWLDPFPDPDRHKYQIGEWDLREDCLAMDATSGAVSTAACATALPAACVVRPSRERRLSALACPDGYAASRYHSAGGALHCFRAERSPEALSYEEAMRAHPCAAAPRAPIARALLRYVMPKLADELSLDDDERRSSCWTNFRPSDPQKDIRLETASNASLPGAADLAPDYPVDVISDAGNVTRLTSGYKLRCVVCETEAVVPEVEMSLRRDPRRRKLVLSVYGSSGLWRESKRHLGFRCFTNARGGYEREVDVKRTWSGHWTLDNLEDFLASGESGRRPNLDLDVEKTLYEVEYEEKSAGRYWCEGHAVGSFKSVKSNVVLVRGKTPGHVYSLAVDIDHICKYKSTLCDPTFHENFEKIGKRIRKKMPDSLISNVRFMRILNVAGNGTVSIVLHVVPEFIENTTAEDFQRMSDVMKTYLRDETSSYHFRSLLSTEGCVPLTDTSGHVRLVWNFTPLGAVGVPKQLCLQSDGMPVSRPCRGDFVSGGEWGPVSGECTQHTMSPVTASLHEIASRRVSVSDGQAIAENVSALTANSDVLTPADVFYAAQTMRNLARSGAYGGPLTKDDAASGLKAVSDIVNHISLANDKCVIVSQRRLNASSMLLDAVDVLFDRITSRVDDEDDDDVLLAVTPYVLVQVTDIAKTNVTGLALLRRDTEDSGEPPTDFTKYDVVHLESTEHLETVLQYSDLEVAVWAPHNLVEFIFNSTGNSSWYDPQPNQGNTTSEGRSRIVITLFYKDLTFYNNTEEVPQDDSDNSTSSATETEQRETKVGSRIVSVSIPGFSRSLPVPIPIIFRPLVDQAKSRECAYWDFTYNSSTPSQSMGGWSSEGCVYAGNTSTDTPSGQLDVCLCTHLTHFAELLGSRYGRISLSQEATFETDVTMQAHAKALDAITLMGCCLSLFGIAGIIVTAVAFRTWRQKPGSKILLQLSAALGFQIILLMVSGTIRTSKDKPHVCHITVFENATMKETQSNSCSTTTGSGDTVCIVLGALLHYFSLSAFTWMFITALLQFTRYVKILGPTRPPRFFLKSLLFGWGVPLVPVILLASVSPDSYVQPSLCYPFGTGLYTAVLVPILIFLTMNLSVFVMVINSIVRGPDGKLRSCPERKLVVSQLKLSVLLFFLLGLSWLFGLLVVSGSGIIFSYLFCIVATLQGFVMFVFFVACDPSTRKLWRATFGSWSNLVLLKLGPTESSADLTSSVSTIHREPNTETSDTM